LENREAGLTCFRALQVSALLVRFTSTGRYSSDNIHHFIFLLASAKAMVLATLALPCNGVVGMLFQVAHGLSVELTFIVVFGFLWVAGRRAEVALFRKNQRSDVRKATPGTRMSWQTAPTLSKVPEQRDRSHASPGSRSRVRDAAAELQRAPATSKPAAELDPSLLCDPAWLVNEVVQMSRTQVQRALEIYRTAMLVGLSLRHMPQADCRNLFMELVTSAIRAGKTDEALRLLHDLREQGPGVTVALLASSTKLCTSKQLYHECLAIYDYVSSDSSLRIGDKSIWSCLLFCAVETGLLQRCHFFFEKLKASGAPSLKDYGNMIRCASMTNDCELALALVQELRELGASIDTVVYNTVLAACVAADRVEEARILLGEMEAVGGVTDVITYNLLAKGYAKAGHINRCFQLFDQMLGQNIKPSQVTYGILLDCCINMNEVNKAAEVFDRMTNEGCEMNTVLYTILIKGFARAGQVDQAMHVYEQMRTGRSVPPDLITFSILIKANCDDRRLEAALQLLEAMLEFKLKPDEVIFNNLLGGCVKESNAELAKRIYEDMIAAGIRPSNATFSILIRLYSQCRLLDEAVDMLQREPAAQGVSPGPQVFSQLVLCCLRERQGRRAVEVYKLLLEHSSPISAATHSSILGMCVKLNMLDTGAEILGLAAEANGSVDACDAQHLLEAAQRKRKTQCVDACIIAMGRWGIASIIAGH